MPEVIVPPFPGVTSAHGPALRRPPRRLLVVVRAPPATRSTSATSRRIYDEMEERVVGNLTRQGVARDDDRGRARASTSATSGSSTRSRCRSPEIERAGLRDRRRELPRRAPAPVPLLAPEESPVETSTLRVARAASATKPDLRAIAHADRARARCPRASGACTSTARLGRDARARPHRPRRGRRASTGPAIVEELDSTIVLPPGTSATGRRRRQHHHHAGPRGGLAMSDGGIDAAGGSTRSRSRSCATPS